MKVNIDLPKLPIFNNPNQLDKAVRIAGLSILAIQKQRIFDKGINADNKIFGKYSKSYLKYRQKKVRRSNTQINFTLSGEMAREYSFGSANNGYALGFASQKNNNSKDPNASQKAEYNELKYKGLFNLSRKESKLFKSIILENIKI